MHYKHICRRVIPVTLNNASMPAWYDIYGMTLDAPQDEGGIAIAVADGSFVLFAYCDQFPRWCKLR